MIDKLNKEDFDAQVGSKVKLQLDQESGCDLVLEEVVHIGAKQARGASRHAFSLLLRGPEDLDLQQQIYKVEIGEMEAMHLFVVPLGPDPATGAMLFEVVFT